LFRLSSVHKQHKLSQTIINNFIDEIIKKKINELLNQNAENEKKIVQDELIFRKMKTVIEILLGHYHEISHEQIRDELVTIMIGKVVILTNYY